MATYIVTTSNWNDPGFWSAISQAGPGHTLDFSALPSGYSVDFWPDADRIVLSDGASNFVVGDSDFGGSANATLGGTTQLEYFTTVIGAQGSDIVDGSNTNDSLSGEGGNDEMYGHAGDDTIRGGDGTDTLYGNEDNDEIHGDAGNDSLFGGFGDDALYGGDGDDVLQGEQGNDTIVGGAGDDTIRISDGAGVDSIDGSESAGDSDQLAFVSATPVVVTFTDLENGSYAFSGGGGASGTFANIEDFNGGSGNDTLDLSALGAAVTVVYSGTGAGTITDGSDTISFSSVESLILTEFNDSVDASATHSGLIGDAPGVDIDGRGGDDTIIGGRGGDTIDGGIGADLIEGDYGDDSLVGGDGNDTILGGNGNETILGGDGADSIDGGIQDDTLDGGAGSDTILGGDGNDTIAGGEGADSITGGDGTDSIAGDSQWIDPADYASVTAGPSTTLTVVNSADGPINVWWVDDFGMPVFMSTVPPGGSVDISTFEEHNFILSDEDGNYLGVIEGAPNQTVTYGAEGLNDYIDGGTGNDAILGQFGNDTILGGAGDDTLDGGTGADALTGGTGSDVLTGGEGNDVFTYIAGDGSDTITDFNTGNTGALDDGDTTNNDFIDLGKFYDNLSELHADYADDGVLNQSNATENGGDVDYTNNTRFGAGEGITFTGASADESSFTAENTGVTCFTHGTAILTPRGDVLIEDLRVGDLVITADNGPQPIRWIGRRMLGRAELAAAPNLRPVLIKPHVLGNERTLLVSPQHCMLMGQDRFVRAKHLAEKHPGIRVAHGKQAICYIHLMFDAHQIIFAEHCPSESFYPGPQSLKMILSETRQELFALFPELKDNPTSRAVIANRYGPTARHVAKKHELLEA